MVIESPALQQARENQRRFERERLEIISKLRQAQKKTREFELLEQQFRDKEVQLRRAKAIANKLAGKETARRRKERLAREKVGIKPTEKKKVIVPKKPKKEFVIRDVKTGKIIERRKAGETIKEVKLRARKKLLAAKTQRERELQETKKRVALAEAKQKEINTLKGYVNSKLRARELFAKGLTSDQVTEILRQREVGIELNKLKNLSTEKFFQALVDPKTGKVRITRAVDRTAQEQAFKIAVNQELEKAGEKKLKFTEPVNKFDNAFQKLKREREKKILTIKQVSLRQTKAQLKAQLFSVEEKVRTKQSVTPTEIAQYQINLNKQGKAITDKQIKTLLFIIKSPVIYGKSLRKRFEAGENNPLFNDIKSVGVGVGKGLKALFVDPLVDSFNYGRKLRIRFEKGEDNPAINDVKKLAKGIKNTSTFVKNNPVQTGIIVGVAVTAGLALTKKEFLKNPAESLGFAIAFLFPGKVLKAGLVTAKVGVKTTAQATKIVANTINKLSLEKVNAGLKILKTKVSPAAKKKQFFELLKGRKDFKITLDELKKVPLDEFNKLFRDKSQKIVIDLTTEIRSATTKEKLFSILANATKSSKKGLQFAFDKLTLKELRTFVTKVIKSRKKVQFKVGSLKNKITIREKATDAFKEFLTKRQIEKGRKVAIKAQKIAEKEKKIIKKEQEKILKKFVQEQQKAVRGARIKEDIYFSVSKITNLPKTLVKNLFSKLGFDKLNLKQLKTSVLKMYRTIKPIKFKAGTKQEIKLDRLKKALEKKEIKKLLKEKVKIEKITKKEILKRKKAEQEIAKQILRREKEKEFAEKIQKLKKINIKDEVFTFLAKNININKVILKKAFSKLTLKQLKSLGSKSFKRKIKFKAGTKEEIKLDKLKKALAKKELKKGVKIKKKAEKIAKEVRKAELKKIKKAIKIIEKPPKVKVPKPKRGIAQLRASKKAQLRTGKLMQKQVGQITDKTDDAFKAAKQGIQKKVIKFRVGDVDPQLKAAQKMLLRLQLELKAKRLVRSLYLTLRSDILTDIFRLYTLRFFFQTYPDLIKVPDKERLIIFRDAQRFIDKLKKEQIPKDLKDITQIKDIEKIKARGQIKIQRFRKAILPKIRPFLKPRKPPVKPPKKKKLILKLRTKNLPKGGSRQGYLVFIKEGNRIVAQTEESLPNKRATNFMREYLDRKPQASGEVRPKGKTDIRDVKKLRLGEKFRGKRSKKTKVLPQVEKRRFRLDKAGEKAIAKIKRKVKKVIKKKK